MAKTRRLYGILAACVAIAALALPARAADDYPLGPDSQRQPGVPQGTVTRYAWTSRIFPGTERSYWVYVPKQYDPTKPACVMVFQDGGGFQDVNGQFRVPVVFDNLIAKKEMPVTIAIMIEPGIVPAASANALPRFNRSFEYDTPDDRYARFLLEEILPEVGKRYNLTREAGGRAICGASSGGICAFTAAWQRPDQFSRVISFIGSFTDLRGGNTYPSLIRKTEPKPIRVFMQDGVNDQDIYSGNWYIGNTDVAAALKFARYEMQFVTGSGGHDGRQGGSILPDALRWLWRDYPAPISTPTSTPQPVMAVLRPGEGWQSVPIEAASADALAVDATGAVYFAAEKGIYRLDAAGHATLFRAQTGRVSGLAFGPDGSLYACLPDRRRIVRYDADGRETLLARDVTARRLSITHQGDGYAADPQQGRVWHLLPNGRKRVVGDTLAGANSVLLTPDQSLLLVAQASPGKYVVSYHRQPDGALSAGQPYFDLQIPYGQAASGAQAMTVDTEGRLYVATAAGLQVCDQAGRVIGVILNPERAPATSLVFGGPERDTLYVTAGGKIYKRKTQAKGVLSFQEPIRPPLPRL
ncbi:MAG TPA: SMP-30/gluconolactonase/LRE family protein [Chthonomonadaceae bacterium]|nr:SMP-30/gluconolactonase/LRE family protein [Chthonomonadaceae bacterium]